MLVASRFDYRAAAAARAAAPPRARSCLCAAVLVVGAPDQRRAPLARRRAGRPSSRPSSRSSRSLIWAAAYLARRGAPRTLGELVRSRSGWSRRSSALLILLEPDLGTTIALVLMLGGDARSSPACPRRMLAGAGALAVAARARRDLDRALPPRARLQLPRPVERRAGHGLPDRPGDDRARLGRALRQGARRGRPEDQLPARGAHRHDLRGRSARSSGSSARRP